MCVCVLFTADQWDDEYVLFLLDCIERPPEEDEEDQIPDAFLNMILSFNQHFTGNYTSVCVCVCGVLSMHGSRNQGRGRGERDHTDC